MRPTRDRLRELQEKVTALDFLENKGLSNEVGYHIFDYPEKDELVVREWLGNNRIGGKVSLVTIDLYDMILDLLESDEYLEHCFKFEKQKGLAHLGEVIERLIEVKHDSGWLVSSVRDKVSEAEADILFVHGVGKIYPLIRSHGVLNILHQNLDEIPVVLFYPGRYNEQDLVLFSRIDDGNYYRAFRIIKD